jgi:hypothetical protein
MKQDIDERCKAMRVLFGSCDEEMRFKQRSSFALNQRSLGGNGLGSALDVGL